MQRFFVKDALGEQELLLTESEQIHQITKVLRAKPKDQFVFFNGDGWEYTYWIESIEKRKLVLTLQGKYKNTADPKVHIALHQALPNKFEKIEYILQKGVEVGVSSFVFFRTKRSQKLNISENKIRRFHKIVVEALEQCQGNTLPDVSFVEKLEMSEPSETHVILDPSGEPINSLGKQQNVHIYVGPEGGWSDEELASFRKQKAHIVSFGDRILRTETAGPVMTMLLLNR